MREIKKYRVVCYVRVDVPVEEDELYETREKAQEVYEHCSALQLENIYMIEEVNDVEKT